MIEISKIRIDGGTQARAELHQETVAEYAEAYKSGASMPAITVFYDGSTYWLADGFHRFFGAKAAGLVEIYEEIIPGTLEDAILASLGANSKHGLRRTNADKRRAVMTMLDHSVWATWSSNEIAKRCAVSHTFVDQIKSSLATLQVRNEKKDERTYTTKHGTTATMNTANIGKKQEPPADPEIEQTTTHEDNVEPEYTELDAAKDQISDLQDALAVSSLSQEDKTQAENLISQLREEIKNQSVTIKALTQSRDNLMIENTQLKKQLAMQRQEIKQLRSR